MEHLAALGSTSVEVVSGQLACRAEVGTVLSMADGVAQNVWSSLSMSSYRCLQTYPLLSLHRGFIPGRRNIDGEGGRRPGIGRGAATRIKDVKGMLYRVRRKYW